MKKFQLIMFIFTTPLVFTGCEIDIDDSLELESMVLLTQMEAPIERISCIESHIQPENL